MAQTELDALKNAQLALRIWIANRNDNDADGEAAEYQESYDIIQRMITDREAPTDTRIAAALAILRADAPIQGAQIERAIAVLSNAPVPD